MTTPPTPTPTPVSVSLDGLLDALLVADATGGDDVHGAFVDRRTGEIHTCLEDFEDEAPKDLTNGKRYLRVPTKWDLDLNSRLAFDFAAQELPDDYDKVRGMFHSHGAYRRFRHLVEQRDVLERWYAFEEAATQAALRTWAKENGLAVREDVRHAGPAP